MGDMGMARKAQRFQFLRLFVKEVGIGFVMHCQLILSRAAALALVASSLNNRSALLLPPRRPQIAEVRRVLCCPMFFGPTLFHVQRRMSGLIRQKGQVIQCIIRWVAIEVVNYFLRGQESSQVLLHDVSMLQDIFQAARRVAIGGIRMIIGGDDQNVPVLPDFTAAFPLGGKLFALAEHRVSRPFQPLSIHRILFTANIPMIGRVCLRKVTGSRGATFRTVDLIGLRWVAPKVLAALRTLRYLTFALEITSTPVGTKSQSNTRIRSVNLFTVFARPFYHTLNCTRYWSL